MEWIAARLRSIRADDLSVPCGKGIPEQSAIPNERHAGLKIPPPAENGESRRKVQFLH
jgi:hypothetical protein